MPLLVHGKDAEYLLKMDACDLRQNPNELKQLRERLFILWGDLEEVKKKTNKEGEVPVPKNRPFECVIQEYGVQDDDKEWIRMHRMTGTTIRED
jgi:protection-of-telomeres protein 1